ncbi:MAG: hypothetical protein AAGF26_07370 [Cyanobacteria bacterium P01_G01_bin.49]
MPLEFEVRNPWQNLDLWPILLYKSCVKKLKVVITTLAKSKVLIISKAIARAIAVHQVTVLRIRDIQER